VKLPVRPATFVGLMALAALGACTDAGPLESPLTFERYSKQLETTGMGRTLLGRAWLDAAQRALVDPTSVELPYAQWGGFLAHSPSALGLAFAGFEDQVLALELTRPEQRAPGTGEGRIYVELFRVEGRGDRVRHVRLAGAPADSAAFQFRLPQRATYIVRLQPELATDALYHLTLELDAALPFPISGLRDDSVGSFFGAPRDGGARGHEGIDIFAPRLTPVLAVADGRATPRQNRLGGKTVWLNTPGKSYYYAHLERAAVRGGQRVRAGDVLGYVGNSGNAIATLPHLHFGIYDWGKGAVDPLPLLRSQRFGGDAGEHRRLEPYYAATTGGPLNLRRAPSRASPIVEQLRRATIVHATGASGDWLRVRLPHRQIGWIHSEYHSPLSATGSDWQAATPTFLFDSIGTAAMAVDFVPAGTVLQVLAEADDVVLLQNAATARHGWVEVL
jgi:murein DD-endopeptidase MepM/ murein hydrolase activator NlpD